MSAGDSHRRQNTCRPQKVHELPTCGEHELQKCGLYALGGQCSVKNFISCLP